MKKRLLVFIIFIFVLSFSFMHSDNRALDTFDSLTDELNIKQIILETPSGTPPHIEDEYKFSVSGNEYILKKNSYLISKIQQGLKTAVSNDFLWKIPQILGNSYMMSNTGKGTFCFMDIYLDTEKYLNKKMNVSHRIRYRWHSENAFWKYILGNRLLENLPHRCEFQTKIYPKNSDKTADISRALESRFEFRNESFPFKIDKSAPEAPWLFNEFVPMAIRGHYKNFTVYPAFEYAMHLRSMNKDLNSVILKPSVIVVTVRRRLHIDLVTSFGQLSSSLGMGAITNANQAILITLDTSTIFSPSLLKTFAFTDFAMKNKSLTKRLVKRLKNFIKPLGNFAELEFEFERNVSSAVNYEINKSKDPLKLKHLKDIKAAFFSDVKTTSEIVKNELEKIGLNIKISKVTKYRRALNILFSAKNAD